MKEKMKQAFADYKFFFIAIALLWIKTYVVYKTAFELPMDNKVQELILFINPISSVILFLGLTLYFKGRAHRRMIVAVSAIMSFVMYANMVFYRFFNDFITIPVLFQTSNMGDLGNSVFELIQPTDLLVFIDIVILAYFMRRADYRPARASRKQITITFAAAIVFFIVNVGIAETERPQLLTRTFDREMLIKNIGSYNYHIYDSIIQSKAKAQRAFADGSEITDIENYSRANYKEPNPEMFGKAKGKNVFVISVESTQNFVINESVNGKEITPFMNDLIEDSYYFPNFYHQTGQGKTSDSEFLLDNSLYPLPSGAVFFTHSQNQYNATPEILKEQGYYSSVQHANNKSFWNRDIMYDNFGYDRYYSLKDFEVTPENSIGWGLKDKDFFKQSIPHLKEMQAMNKPFYTKYITLTNHFPFTLEEEDEMIPEWTSNDGTVNRYFTTVRYTDEALKEFFADVKEAGLYEDSIFIMYGDHYGISENHNDAMGQFLGKEITPFESTQLQKVPLIIHMPGEKGKVMNSVGGQVDLKPTILHLLGIDTKGDIQLGSDLFSKDHEDFAVLRDNSYITKDNVFTDGKCYDKATGQPVEGENNGCEPYSERAKTELDISDRIIYGDLLRFYDKDKAKDKALDKENKEKQKQ
ncbi:LTA synthase family protein [Fictibacillus sp. b24]|uniref:LTA synthase family protein n=1 Tax=Fictibacillus sp. b24 TaxID=3055863 RepID=UPI00259FF786|nr:LTA synthase family protein [Fictibacillus sp. b24]MDM5315915.1 LTA synthase family protein [Fictibacillus sp. b24]